MRKGREMKKRFGFRVLGSFLTLMLCMGLLLSSAAPAFATEDFEYGNSSGSEAVVTEEPVAADEPVVTEEPVAGAPVSDEAEPIAAFAAGAPVSDEAGLAAALLAGGDYYLTADIETTAPLSISVGVNVALDLAGFTLDLAGGTLTNSGTLTIDDPSPPYDAGWIQTDENHTLVVNQGEIVINGGNLLADSVALLNETGALATINGGSVGAKFVALENRGSAVVNGGMLVGTDGVGGTAVCLVALGDSDSNLTVNGGILSAGAYAFCFDFENATTGSINITLNGGDIYGDFMDKIEYGTYEGDGVIILQTDDITIDPEGGGRPLTMPSSVTYTIPQGVTLTIENGLDNYGTIIVGGTLIVNGNRDGWGSEIYAVYNEAQLAAALATGGIYYLGDSFQATGPLVVSGVSFTLDLHGQTLTLADSITVSSSAALTIIDSMGPGTGKITTSANAPIFVNYGGLTIDGGTIERTGGDGCLIDNVGVDAGISLGGMSGAVYISTSLTAPLILNRDGADARIYKGSFYSPYVAVRNGAGSTIWFVGGTFVAGDTAFENLGGSGDAEIDGGTFMDSAGGTTVCPGVSGLEVSQTANITVSGDLIIPPGVTYTIEAGATLTIDGDLYIIGALIVNGTLIVNGNTYGAIKTDYDVWCNGERFTSDHLTISCGAGTAVYDPATSTLTLTNATIDTGCAIPAELVNAYDGAGIFTLVDLNVVLIGDNVIEDTGGVGIDTWATDPDTYEPFNTSISLSGGGTLTIAEPTGYGIYATKNLTVENVTLYLDAAGASLWTQNDLVVRNSTVVITKSGYSGYGIYVSGDGSALFDGSVLIGNRQPIFKTDIADPANALMLLDNGSYTLENGGVIITYDPATATFTEGTDEGIVSDPAGIAVWGASGSTGLPGYVYVRIPGVTVTGSGGAGPGGMFVPGLSGSPTLVYNETQLIAALAAGGAYSLAADITTTAPLSILPGVDVTLDLNGFTLNLDGGTLTNSGTLTIDDRSSSGNGTITTAANQPLLVNQGELVIDGGSFTAGHVVLENQGSAVINGGSFTATDPADGTVVYQAAQGSHDSALTINGGTLSGAYSICFDLESATTASIDVTINGGELTGDFNSKPGASSYTGDGVAVLQSGGSTIVLDGDLTIPEGVTYTIDAGATLRVPDGTTLTVEGSLINNGTLIIEGKLVVNGSLSGIPPVYVRAETSISLTPSHAIFSKATDEVTFTAVFSPDVNVNYNKIVWTVEGGTIDVGGTPTDIVTRVPIPGDNKRLKFVPNPSVDIAKTVRVTATYDGIYSATATIETVPLGGLTADTTVKVLEKTVAVNKAKEVSARVPILITKQPPENMGLGAFDAAAATPGAKNIAEARLTQNGTPLPAAQFTANICRDDDRYIEIHATLDAVTTKNVRVELLPEGVVNPTDADWIKAGAADLITLKVSETYPKIAITTADALNLFYNKNASGLETVLVGKASDGSEVEVKSVALVNATKDGRIIGIDQTNHMTLTAKAKGTAKVNVTVDLKGYHRAVKKAGADGFVIKNVPVKVDSTMPSLKLNKTKVKLYDDPAASVGIRLLSGGKTPFGDGYTVSNVTLAGTYTGVALEPYLGGGVITVKPVAGFSKGKAVLTVSFAESTMTKDYTLNIDKAATDKLTAAANPKEVAVSVGHAGFIADIAVTPNAENAVLGNLSVKSYDVGKAKGNTFSGSDLAGAINVSCTPNKVSLSVSPSATPATLGALRVDGKDTKYTLNIENSAAPGLQKTFSVAITITDKAPTFKVALDKKTAIDIANPDSYIAGTVTLSNTTSPIDYVVLYDQKLVNKKPQVPTAVSQDFKASVVGLNKIKITPKHKQIVPGVAKKLSVEIHLKNGQVATSWGAPNASGAVTDKPIAVTPKQTASKTNVAKNKTAVTLYKAQPLQGARIQPMRLTTPENVKIGAVQIGQKGIDALRFVKEAPSGTGPGFYTIGAKTYQQVEAFYLVRNGENDWTIYFEDGQAPAGTVNAKGTKLTALKASYKIKAEIWAEGTYQLNALGQPVLVKGKVQPLVNGAKKSKPTVVTITVSIK